MSTITNALQAQLLDVSASANRSAEAEQEAQHRMDALKAEEKKRGDDYGPGPRYENLPAGPWELLVF